MKIDVCIVSRDGKKPRGLSNIPINNLIIETSKPLAYARWMTIKRVETNYFAFIDDDVILPDNWFDELIKYISIYNVGAIYGTNIIKGLGQNLEKEQIKLFGDKIRFIKKGERGDTNNIIIKKELVSDWTFTKAPFCYEDHDLINHILNKGYEVLKIPVHPISVYHLKTWRGLIKNGIWAGENWHGYFKKNRFFQILKAFLHPFTFLIKFMPFMFFYSLIMNISFIIGIFKSFIPLRIRT